MKIANDLDEPRLNRLVNHFYAQVRADPLLGPLFNQAIADWPEHLQRLATFWSSVMLMTGRYKGQPVPAHMRHQAGITPDMFQRWLALWEDSAAQCLPPEAAAAAMIKAHSIADSLQMALFQRQPPLFAGPHPAVVQAGR